MSISEDKSLASLCRHTNGKLKGTLWLTGSCKAPGWPCLYKGTSDFRHWCRMPPRCRAFGYGLPSHGHYAEGVCDVPKRMAIQAIVLGPWQKRRKQIGCKFLKEIILRRWNLGSSRIPCRDYSGWVSFWQTYCNSETMPGERKVNMAFWRDAWERPRDDSINRPFDFVFASSLGHLRAVVLRLRSLRGMEGWLLCPCGMASLLNEAGDEVLSRK